MNEVKFLEGNCLETLKTLPDESINCCVTSPPYYNLRDYGIEGQLGQEDSPEAYVQNLVNVFREVKRVLRNDGTLWINLGDSYAGSGKGCNTDGTPHKNSLTSLSGTNKGCVTGTFKIQKAKSIGAKPKDLLGIPWLVAFALRADGWYLRQEIIWSKKNGLPESVKDRPTRSHEQIFLLSKSLKYFYDYEEIKEPITDPSAIKILQKIEDKKSTDLCQGKTRDSALDIGGKLFESSMGGGGTSFPGHSGYFTKDGKCLIKPTRNKRSVWHLATKPFRGAHFAVFPPALIEPCILAGCPIGGTILDPFGGSGTTGLVSVNNNRNAILCDLNPSYIELAKNRIEENRTDTGKFIDKKKRLPKSVNKTELIQLEMNLPEKEIPKTVLEQLELAI